MPIPDHLKSFIFECLDSVESLEVLLLLFRDPKRAWTADELASELRFNANSVAERLRRLVDCGLLTRTDAGFVYGSERGRTTVLLDELNSFYRTHPHRILEAIFSPMRKAHDFARAFRVRAHRPKEDEHGD